MNRAGMITRSFAAVALALLAWGCSEGRSSAPQLNPTTGEHPAAWVQNHWAEYVKHPDQCATCHGSTTDPAAAGGIAKVSCFTCHADGVKHPEGWAAPSQHGRRGAQLAPVPTDPKAMAGFAHCAKCHGDDFKGGLSGVSCNACHTHSKAPLHPDAPWRGNTTALSNHDKTDINNAIVCAQCHLASAGTKQLPLAIPPAPGCYNNTLCHGSTFAD